MGTPHRVDLIPPRPARWSHLHHHDEEVVDVGNAVELLKQRQGQEGQQGVLIAAHSVVLATRQLVRVPGKRKNGFNRVGREREG